MERTPSPNWPFVDLSTNSDIDFGSTERTFQEPRTLFFHALKA